MSEGTNRNKRCSCGSGKKFKNCCLLNRKPRTTSITMDMGKPVAIDAVRVTPNGEVALFHKGQQINPVQAHLETSYERGKKAKVLHKSEIPVEKLKTDIHASFCNYDLFYVIDTNTRIVNNHKISIACVLLCKFQPSGDMTLAFFAPIHAFEFWNIVDKPENIAWREAIMAIMANPDYKKEFRTGILVDSDLGDIPAFNSRHKPIIDDFYLPDNFELIYASADVGKEYFVNKLISECDKEANKIFKIIETAPHDHPSLVTVEDKPFTHQRVWNNS